MLLHQNIGLFSHSLNFSLFHLLYGIELAIFFGDRLINDGEISSPHMSQLTKLVQPFFLLLFGLCVLLVCIRGRGFLPTDFLMLWPVCPLALLITIVDDLAS